VTKELEGFDLAGLLDVIEVPRRSLSPTVTVA
jgi:hypothetical protein